MTTAAPRCPTSPASAASSSTTRSNSSRRLLVLLLLLLALVLATMASSATSAARGAISSSSHAAYIGSWAASPLLRRRAAATTRLASSRLFQPRGSMQQQQRQPRASFSGGPSKGSGLREDLTRLWSTLSNSTRVSHVRKITTTKISRPSDWSIDLSIILLRIHHRHTPNNNQTHRSRTTASRR